MGGEPSGPWGGKGEEAGFEERWRPISHHPESNRLEKGRRKSPPGIKEKKNKSTGLLSEKKNGAGGKKVWGWGGVRKPHRKWLIPLYLQTIILYISIFKRPKH